MSENMKKLNYWRISYQIMTSKLPITFFHIDDLKCKHISAFYPAYHETKYQLIFISMKKIINTQVSVFLFAEHIPGKKTILQLD